MLTLCCAAPAAAAELPQVPWLSYTLAAKCVEDDPDRIVCNPALADERFVVVTFKAVDAKVMIADIMDNVELFSMEDERGNYYPAAAFFPRTMIYMPGPGMFGTSPEQTSFDIMFLLPTGLALDSVKVCVENDFGGKVRSIPLSDVPLVADEA